ncbi:MAG: DUF484 family protein [Gammaproteobacteria bacterium]
MQEPLSLSAADVENYLRAHPDFFSEHLHLLEELTVPHPSGDAISLIAKQLEIFRNRHHDMENQLNALIDIARENDTALHRMHDLTLAMLEAASLEEILANLEQVFFRSFQADFFALRIFRERPDFPVSNLFVSSEDPQVAAFQASIRGSQPQCMRPTFAQAQFLFGDAAFEVKSAALIPLHFTELEGILAVGSRETDRFHHSMGNMFLVQMSTIVGTRLISLLKSKPV